MSFWEINNIDMWLLTGVLFNIFWVILKALEHDAERHEQRIKDLEWDVERLKAKRRRENDSK